MISGLFYLWGYVRLFFSAVIIIIMFYFVSCSNTQIPIDVTKTYKHDIYISNKDGSGLGMIALKKKPLYTFEFESEGIMDFFTFRTCSREIAIEDARRGLNRKKVLLNYSPNAVEQSQKCPAYINSFAENGRHASGYIDFEDDLDTLPAKLTCGELETSTNGVSVCQGRVGLMQKIEFNTDVIISPEKGCDSINSSNSRSFWFSIDPNDCVIVFMEKEVPHRTHRLVTHGYTEIIIRR